MFLLYNELDRKGHKARYDLALKRILNRWSGDALAIIVVDYEWNPGRRSERQGFIKLFLSG